MKRLSVSIAVSINLIAGMALAQTPVLSLTPSFLPSYFGVGIGGYPDYLGSDDYSVGALPFGRHSFGEQRYVALEGNYLTLNLVEHRNWRAGPVGLWRFGRKDVEDKVVAKLPEVDGSLELGGFVAYEDVGQDPRDRWRLGASFIHGVSGDNEGFTVAVDARRWLPVGRYGALGLSVGASYGSEKYMDTYFSITPAGSAASGLSTFDAGSGVRDVRAMVVFIHPVSREWQVGGGVLFSHLLNDAADSPIVSQRGDANQVIFGIGVSRAF